MRLARCENVVLASTYPFLCMAAFKKQPHSVWNTNPIKFDEGKYNLFKTEQKTTEALTF